MTSPDCNDSDSTIYPGAVEICGDSIDNNCNASDDNCIDTDGDGMSNDIDTDDDNDGISDSSDPCQLHKPARIAGTPQIYYSSLQEAYDNANTNDTVQYHETIYNGDLFADINKTVTIEGGYNCSHTAVSGLTKIYGNIIISSGSVTFKNIVAD